VNYCPCPYSREKCDKCLDLEQQLQWERENNQLDRDDHWRLKLELSMLKEVLKKENYIACGNERIGWWLHKKKGEPWWKRLLKGKEA